MRHDREIADMFEVCCHGGGYAAVLGVGHTSYAIIGSVSSAKGLQNMKTMDDFEDWVEGADFTHVKLMGSRAALRLLPFAFEAGEHSIRKEQLLLSCLRAIMSSIVSTRSNDGTVASARMSAARWSAEKSGNQIARASRLVGRAQSSEQRTMATQENELGIASNSIASLTHSTKPSEVLKAFGRLELSSRTFFQDAVYDSLILDEANSSLNQLRKMKLWYLDWSTTAHIRKELLLRFPDIVGEAWSFWREWYQGFLEGKPLDWDLQREVALIPNEDWEKGPEHIAGIIAEIRARFELNKRIGELEEELRVTAQSRHEIGGNFPPEPLDEARVATKELLIIWEPLQSLKEEAEAEAPDKGKIRKAIEALGRALKAGFAWCASKADLAVDTVIKWAVPAAGGGYLALNPDKITAVLEVAKTWLSMAP